MEGTVLCAANHAPLTPISFLERTALVYPDRPAVVAAGHSATPRTWRETRERCLRLAAALAGLGVERHDVALFMLYDHKNTTPNGASAHLMRSVLENLNHRHFQDNCLVGSGGGSVGYLAHGTTTDYMHDIAKVPMPFTFEIYGDEKASTDDCFKMFNPVDKTTFDRVINKWCMAFLILFEEGLRNLREAQIVS